MTFNEYQRESRRTALYPAKGYGLTYPVLGLVGESGEVAEKMKKILRDHDVQINDGHKQEIIKELGDVLWYLAQIAADLDFDLEEVAQRNLAKTQSRQARGMLQGNGDNR